MRSLVWKLRLAALMGAGTFGVHQLRFALSGDGEQAGVGHGYLALVGPVLAGLLLLAFAAALQRVARGAVEPVPRFRRLWAGTSASLLAAYCAQESIEGLLTHGHAAGMFQHGGWVALPLALTVALAIALITRGTAAASVLVAGRAPRARVPQSPAIEALLPPWTARRLSAAASHLAARGPPVHSG